MNKNRFKKYYLINNKMIPFIEGGKGCFAAGTHISTPKGEIPIENIKIGMEVYCFDDKGNIQVSKVTETFYHEQDDIIKLYIWGINKPIQVTLNHWFLTENNTFNELGLFDVGDMLITEYGTLLPITKIDIVKDKKSTYNFTVEKFNTYIAEGIRVHNKGGGKAGGGSGSEDPNNLFSTDILFITTAVGEGPIYRINPNGPQDIEINESAIDNLLLLDSGGIEDSDVFHTETTTGTITQDKMPVFGEEVIVPQSLSAPISLKKGNLVGIPKASLILQTTSIGSYEELRFLFSLNALQRMDSDGNIFGHFVSVRVSIFESDGITLITAVERTIEGKTNAPVRFSLPIIIPISLIDTNGYKFSVEKISNETDNNKIIDNISFIGWQEVQKQEQAYPRTALIGYALKAFNQYTGGVPNFTSKIKGLICKVPSNYNQPILENGEIDWRQVEIPDSLRVSQGYRLQKTGSVIQFDQNPLIYDGLWDGSFSFSYTQNPVWIIYDILTSTTYGLGIPEENIDKFKFYKVAQYCDAVNASTGTFDGVNGLADGGYRYKPLGLFTLIRESLLGLTEGTTIKERRFVCDLTISNQSQVLEIINLVTATFRGILFYAGGKITLNVDLPEDIPVAIFSEVNIKKDSLTIAGIRESDLLTGVEVSYIEPTNHFKREIVRIDDPASLRERTNIENVAKVTLTGVTRRSQAIRFGQYLLASSKFLRRRLTFTTNIESINISIGDIISVSQKLPGVAWGFGGRVFSNSSISNSDVKLEHFTSPSIGASTFTSNTLPVGLRIIGKESDRVDLYILSDTDFTFKSTSNVVSGFDIVEVNIKDTLNLLTKSFLGTASTFTGNNVPQKGDLWTLGEINTTDFYKGQNDKLFKVTSMERDETEEIQISAVEYVSNVYIDSDTLISYVPTRYFDTISPLTSPPSPELELRGKLLRLADKSVINEIEVFATYDFTAYPINIETEYEYAVPDSLFEIQGIQ